MGALHGKLVRLCVLFRYLQEAREPSARKASSSLLTVWMPEMDEVWKESINRAPQQLVQSAKNALDIVFA